MKQVELNIKYDSEGLYLRITVMPNTGDIPELIHKLLTDCTIMGGDIKYVPGGCTVGEPEKTYEHYEIRANKNG